MASDRTQRRIDLLLDEAEEAITQLNWQVVGDRARAVLALEPGNRDAINFLAAAERSVSDSDTSSPSPPARVHRSGSGVAHLLRHG